MVIKLKKLRKIKKRNIGIHKGFKNRSKKEVVKMTPVNLNNKHEVDNENVNFDCITNIMNIVQKTIKEKGLTEKQIRMSFGVKRYEK